MVLLSKQLSHYCVTKSSWSASVIHSLSCAVVRENSRANWAVVLENTCDYSCSFNWEFKRYGFDLRENKETNQVIFNIGFLTSVFPLFLTKNSLYIIFHFLSIKCEYFKNIKSEPTIYSRTSNNIWRYNPCDNH